MLTGEAQPVEKRNEQISNTLAVAGLIAADGVALLAALCVGGNAAVAQQLHQHYGGNPRLLHQVANLVYELFEGDEIAFVREGLGFGSDLGAGLAQQLAHLAPLEQEVLQQLAQAGRPLDRTTLDAQLTPSPAKCAYFQALQNLRRAFLLQQTDNLVALLALLTTFLAEHPFSPFSSH